MKICNYNLARFMSVDPFVHGGSQGLNPYSYIMNNPLAGVDPSGYAPEYEVTTEEIEGGKLTTLTVTDGDTVHTFKQVALDSGHVTETYDKSVGGETVDSRSATVDLNSKPKDSKPSSGSQNAVSETIGGAVKKIGGAVEKVGEGLQSLGNSLGELSDKLDQKVEELYDAVEVKAGVKLGLGVKVESKHFAAELQTPSVGIGLERKGIGEDSTVDGYAERTNSGAKIRIGVREYGTGSTADGKNIYFDGRAPTDYISDASGKLSDGRLEVQTSGVTVSANALVFEASVKIDTGKVWNAITNWD